jgi:hypothetical protein
MRSKHSSFVVTFSAFAACTPVQPVPANEPVTTTPPDAETAADPEPETPNDAGATAIDPPDAGSADPPANMAAHPVPVNPRDANGRTVKKAWDGNGCFVELPFPPLVPGQQRPPGTPPPSQNVSCPAAMNDPAYDSCKGGVVYTNGERSSCICFVMGNPPPAPTRVTCPK